MSEISIDSASTVHRDQASLNTTYPHSTKKRSQYTLKLKKKKNAENCCEIANSAVEMP